MRGLIGILPWSVVLAIAGAAIWLLLDRNPAIGAWVLGAVIAAHGLVHGLYLVPVPDRASGASGPAWPFDLGRSWLVALAGVRRGRRIAAILVGLVAVLAILAGLATAGVLPPAWWPGLVAGAAVASLALLLAAFDVQLVLGIGIDLALLAVVVTGAWAPGG